MGAQVRYGTIAVGAYSAHQPGSHQRAFTDQYEPKWDRGGARSPKTWKDPNRFDSLWSFGCKIGGGDLEGYGVIGPADQFEPYSCDGPGTQTTKFLKGLCVDSSDVALSGVVVQGFRTSDDQYLGYDVQSRSDGSYDLPSNLPASASYVVAYLAGSPDRGGTTLNTLTPTNIDGS